MSGTVDPAMIERVVTAAAEHGGAIAAMPVVETLKENDGAGQTIDSVYR